jgi:hypothetical protein
MVFDVQPAGSVDHEPQLAGAADRATERRSRLDIHMSADEMLASRPDIQQRPHPGARRAVGRDIG